MIYIESSDEYHPVEPTIFPDGTSQVWKICDVGARVPVKWEFESEAEVFHLCQLLHLLSSHTVELFVPFLPYGRQDKRVSNESTFALRTLGELLDTFGVKSVSTVDAHSQVLGSFGFRFINLSPSEYILDAINRTSADSVCYPDLGAEKRYGDMMLGVGRVVLDKVRDQSTGNITGMRISHTTAVDPREILIVDDICDGGRTFCEAAKVLKKAYPGSSIHLYVTHGIFSKGLAPLLDAGISTFHTMKGVVE